MSKWRELLRVARPSDWRELHAIEGSDMASTAASASDSTADVVTDNDQIAEEESIDARSRKENGGKCQAKTKAKTKTKTKTKAKAKVKTKTKTKANGGVKDAAQANSQQGCKSSSSRGPGESTEASDTPSTPSGPPPGTPTRPSSASVSAASPAAAASADRLFRGERAAPRRPSIQTLTPGSAGGPRRKILEPINALEVMAEFLGDDDRNSKMQEPDWTPKWQHTASEEEKGRR